MRFSQVEAISIGDLSVIELKVNGEVLWASKLKAPIISNSGLVCYIDYTDVRTSSVDVYIDGVYKESLNVKE